MLENAFEQTTWKERRLTIAVQCYKRVENRKNCVALHLNERLHLHIGKYPAPASALLLMYVKNISSRCTDVNNVIGC
jgi:hypothetical protein